MMTLFTWIRLYSSHVKDTISAHIWWYRGTKEFDFIMMVRHCKWTSFGQFKKYRIKW